MLIFSSDASYKQDKFFKTQLKKGLKLALSKKNGTVIFNLSFMLLPAEINPNLEKQSRKKDELIAYSSSHVKIVFILSTKIIIFYMQAIII